MGKSGGFLTPKAIANRMKAKGLTKLKFYCQVCQKACRDANGFKCHIASESHQRQMLVVSENPHKIIGDFSAQFKSGFLAILSRRHGTKRVWANQVYQEYIADRDHVHMNATCWSSLAGFVRTVADQGIVRAEETERGWWITWIDNTPETLAKQAAIQKQERMKKDDEERDREILREQIERAAVVVEAKGETEQGATELKRNEEQGKIKLNLSFAKPAAVATETPQESVKPKMMIGGFKKKPTLASLAKMSAQKPASSTAEPTMSSSSSTSTLLGKRPQTDSDRIQDTKSIKRST